MTSIILPSNTTDPSQITSDTLPTTRADGSPLQIGDRWYKPSMGQEGFWNGTYWLSATLYGVAFAIAATWGAAGTRVATKAFTVDDNWSGLFFVNYSIHVLNQFTTPWDDSNFSTFTPQVTGLGANLFPMTPLTVNNRSLGDNSSFKIIHPLNYFKSIAPNVSGGLAGIRDIQVLTTKTGTGSNVVAQEFITYRGVLP
jgi:hypothetical protein